MQTEESFENYLDNIKERILILLSQHEELEPAQISRLLGTGIEFSLFHLESLKKHHMVMDCNSQNGLTCWRINQVGLDYLANNGLLY